MNEHDKLMVCIKALRNITRSNDSGNYATWILESIGYKEPPKYSDAICPVPRGYDTVLGFLAKHYPDILEAIEWRQPNATVRFGYRLKHAKDYNNSVKLWVEAPKAMKDAGVEKVRVWPIDLLNKVIAAD